MFTQTRKNCLFVRFVAAIIIFAFSASLPAPYIHEANAQSLLGLPTPGMMVNPSMMFAPPTLKGLIINPDKPFEFDFILDTGDTRLNESEIRNESTKLIKYFLASLTMPEDELWVNLSPYEKNRIIPDEFGKTEMGRDLLAQDYLLKQLTASLIYPEDELGQKFWKRIFKKAKEKFGTTDIPVNTFNKVWIIPDKAKIYENIDRAFIVESRLKVMLEEDYVAIRQTQDARRKTQDVILGSGVLGHGSPEDSKTISSQIIREIVIPEIEKEINSGKNFSKLRQVYNSFILASWYKKNLKTSIVARSYADRKKVAGLETDDKDINQKIYERYIEAFQKGVYNFIKEDYDEETHQTIPRKYFSGGMELVDATQRTLIRPRFDSNDYVISTKFGDPTNKAMLADEAGEDDESGEPQLDELAQLQRDAFGHLSKLSRRRAQGGNYDLRDLEKRASRQDIEAARDALTSALAHPGLTEGIHAILTKYYGQILAALDKLDHPDASRAMLSKKEEDLAALKDAYGFLRKLTHGKPSQGQSYNLSGLKDRVSRKELLAADAAFERLNRSTVSRQVKDNMALYHTLILAALAESDGPGTNKAMLSEGKIRDVERIVNGWRLMKDKGEIDKLVEAPLREAVEILFDKNIVTLSTSANGNDIDYFDNAHIVIQFDMLSDENKRIVTETLGLEPQFIRLTDDGEGHHYVQFKMPLTEDSTQEEISQAARVFAEQFKPQEFSPIPINVLRHVTFELQGTVEDFQRLGYIYDSSVDGFRFPEKEKPASKAMLADLDDIVAEGISGKQIVAGTTGQLNNHELDLIVDLLDRVLQRKVLIPDLDKKIIIGHREGEEDKDNRAYVTSAEGITEFDGTVEDLSWKYIPMFESWEDEDELDENMVIAARLMGLAEGDIVLEEDISPQGGTQTANEPEQLEITQNNIEFLQSGENTWVQITYQPALDGIATGPRRTIKGKAKEVIGFLSSIGDLTVIREGRPAIVISTTADGNTPIHGVEALDPVITVIEPLSEDEQAEEAEADEIDDDALVVDDTPFDPFADEDTDVDDEISNQAMLTEELEELAQADDAFLYGVYVVDTPPAWRTELRIDRYRDMIGQVKAFIETHPASQLTKDFNSGKIDAQYLALKLIPVAADIIERQKLADQSRPYVIAMGGPAKWGKTTHVEWLTEILKASRNTDNAAAFISIDDVHLDPSWTGGPVKVGTAKRTPLRILLKWLQQVKKGKELKVDHYEHPPHPNSVRTVPKGVKYLFIESEFALEDVQKGADGTSYQELSKEIDYRIAVRVNPEDIYRTSMAADVNRDELTPEYKAERARLRTKAYIDSVKPKEKDADVVLVAGEGDAFHEIQKVIPQVNKRIAVIGASGFLGRKLYDTYRSFGYDVVGTSHSSPGFYRLDATDEGKVRQFLDEVRPDVVIYTPADIYIDDAQEARRINVDGVSNFGRHFGGHFIYTSTDYVFDGKKPPYQPSAKARPLNEYGRQKLEGEKNTLDKRHQFSKAAVVRMGYLYGHNDSSERVTHIKKVVDSLRERKPFKADTAQVRQPLLTDDVAEYLALVVNEGAEGIQHIGGDDRTTKYGWSQMIADEYYQAVKEIEDVALDDLKALIEPEEVDLSVAPKEAGLVSDALTTTLRKGTRRTVRHILASYEKAKREAERRSEIAAQEITGINQAKRLLNDAVVNGDEILFSHAREAYERLTGGQVTLFSMHAGARLGNTEVLYGNNLDRRIEEIVGQVPADLPYNRFITKKMLLFLQLVFGNGTAGTAAAISVEKARSDSYGRGLKDVLVIRGMGRRSPSSILSHFLSGGQSYQPRMSMGPSGLEVEIPLTHDFRGESLKMPDGVVDVLSGIIGGSGNVVERIVLPDGRFAIRKSVRLDEELVENKLKGEIEKTKRLRAMGLPLPDIYQEREEDGVYTVVMEDLEYQGFVPATSLTYWNGLDTIDGLVIPASAIWGIGTKIYKDLIGPLYSRKVSETPPDYVQRFLIDLVIERRERTKQAAPVLAEMFDAPYLRVVSSHRDYYIPGFDKMLPFIMALDKLGLFTPPYLSDDHGDLNYGDFLIDPRDWTRYGEFVNYRLIDPKDFPGGNDYLSDFAKLIHNHFGKYDVGRMDEIYGYYQARGGEEPSGVVTLVEYFEDEGNPIPFITYDSVSAEIRNWLDRRSDFFDFKDDPQWKIRLMFTHSLMMARIPIFHLRGDGRESPARVFYVKGMESLYLLMDGLIQSDKLTDTLERVAPGTTFRWHQMKREMQQLQPANQAMLADGASVITTDDYLVLAGNELMPEGMFRRYMADSITDLQHFFSAYGEAALDINESDDLKNGNFGINFLSDGTILFHAHFYVNDSYSFIAVLEKNEQGDYEAKHILLEGRVGEFLVSDGIIQEETIKNIKAAVGTFVNTFATFKDDVDGVINSTKPEDSVSFLYRSVKDVDGRHMYHFVNNGSWAYQQEDDSGTVVSWHVESRRVHSVEDIPELVNSAMLADNTSRRLYDQLETLIEKMERTDIELQIRRSAKKLQVILDIPFGPERNTAVSRIIFDFNPLTGHIQTIEKKRYTAFDNRDTSPYQHRTVFFDSEKWQGYAQSSETYTDLNPNPIIGISFSDDLTDLRVVVARGAVQPFRVLFEKKETDFIPSPHARFKVLSRKQADALGVSYTDRAMLGDDDEKASEEARGLAAVKAAFGGEMKSTDVSNQVNVRVYSNGAAVIRYRSQSENEKERHQNMLNTEGFKSLSAALDLAGEDVDIKTVVFDIQTDDGFGTGTSIEEHLIEGGVDNVIPATTELLIKLSQFKKPKGALVRAGKGGKGGYAMGGTLEVLLGMDYSVVVENEKTRFGFPEIKLGALAPYADALLTRRTAYKYKDFENDIRTRAVFASLDWLMGGNVYDYREAKRLGVVDASQTNEQRALQLLIIKLEELEDDDYQPRLSRIFEYKLEEHEIRPVGWKALALINENRKAFPGGVPSAKGIARFNRPEDKSKPYYQLPRVALEASSIAVMEYGLRAGSVEEALRGVQNFYLKTAIRNEDLERYPDLKRAIDEEGGLMPSVIAEYGLRYFLEHGKFPTDWRAETVNPAMLAEKQEFEKRPNDRAMLTDEDADYLERLSKRPALTVELFREMEKWKGAEDNALKEKAERLLLVDTMQLLMQRIYVMNHELAKKDVISVSFQDALLALDEAVEALAKRYEDGTYTERELYKVTVFASQIYAKFGEYLAEAYFEGGEVSPASLKEREIQNIIALVHQHSIELLYLAEQLRWLIFDKTKNIISPYDLNKLVQDNAARFLKGFKGQIETDYDDSLPMLPALTHILNDDFTKVIEEILKNAYFYGTKNIRIATRWDGDNTIVLTVENDGELNAPEDELFDYFVSFAGEEHESRGTGAGLGLAYARLYVQMQGGSITVTQDTDGRSQPIVRTEVRLPVTFTNQAMISERKHEDFHAQLKLDEILADIAREVGADQLPLGTKVYDEESGAREWKRDFHFSQALLDNVQTMPYLSNIKYLRTTHGYIILQDRDVFDEFEELSERYLIIIDNRIDGYHAGRSRRQVYARDFTKAVQGLMEMRLWSAYEKYLQRKDDYEIDDNEHSILPRDIKEWTAANFEKAYSASRKINAYADKQARKFIRSQIHESDKFMAFLNFIGSDEGVGDFEKDDKVLQQVLAHLKTIEEEYAEFRPENPVSLDDVIDEVLDATSGIPDKVEENAMYDAEDLEHMKFTLTGPPTIQQLRKMNMLPIELTIFYRKSTQTWLAESGAIRSSYSYLADMLEPYNDIAYYIHNHPVNVFNAGERKDLPSLSDVYILGKTVHNHKVAIVSPEGITFYSFKEYFEDVEKQIEELLEKIYDFEFKAETGELQLTGPALDEEVFKMLSSIEALELDLYTWDEVEAQGEGILEDHLADNTPWLENINDVIIGDKMRAPLTGTAATEDSDMQDLDVEKFSLRQLLDREILRAFIIFQGRNRKEAIPQVLGISWKTLEKLGYHRFEDLKLRQELGAKYEEWYESPDDIPDIRTKQRIERLAVRKALKEASGNVSQAARMLDVDRTTIYNKMQEYDIPSPERAMLAGWEDKRSSVLIRAIAAGQTLSAGELDELKSLTLMDGKQRRIFGLNAGNVEDKLKERIKWFQKTLPLFKALMKELDIDDLGEEMFWSVYVPMSMWFMERKEQKRPDEAYVIGFSGGLGVGKTTRTKIFSLVLAEMLKERNEQVVVFSIDDLYKTKAEREKLKSRGYFHRGPPGTHDVALGVKTLKDLRETDARSRVELPVFDKAVDDRVAPRIIEGKVGIVIFEGWIVGANTDVNPDLVEEGFKREVAKELRAYKALNDELDDLVVRLLRDLDAIKRMYHDQVARQRARVESQGRKWEGLQPSQIDRFVDSFYVDPWDWTNTSPEPRLADTSIQIVTDDTRNIIDMQLGGRVLPSRAMLAEVQEELSSARKLDFDEQFYAALEQYRAYVALMEHSGDSHSIPNDVKERIAKLERMLKPVADISDPSSFKDFIDEQSFGGDMGRLKDIKDREVILSINRPDVDDSLQVSVLRFNSGGNDITQRNIHLMVVLEPLGDGTSRIVADAVIDVGRQKEFGNPLTATFDRGKGYMQRAITLLLLSGEIVAWYSSISLNEESNNMYERLKQDERLNVIVADFGYVVVRARPDSQTASRAMLGEGQNKKGGYIQRYNLRRIAELSRKGQHQNAVEEAEHLVEQYSDNPRSWVALINALGRAGDKRVLEIGKDAHARFPDNPFILSLYAKAVLLYGQADKAVPLAERAVELSPKYLPFQLTLQRVRDNLQGSDSESADGIQWDNNPRKARRPVARRVAVAKTAGFKPFPKEIRWQIIELTRQRRHGEAIAEAEKLVREYNDNPFAWVTLLGALSFGRSPDAYKIALEAAERFPDNDRVLQEVARVMMYSRHEAEAVRFAAKAWALNNIDANREVYEKAVAFAERAEDWVEKRGPSKAPQKKRYSTPQDVPKPVHIMTKPAKKEEAKPDPAIKELEAKIQAAKTFREVDALRPEVNAITERSVRQPLKDLIVDKNRELSSQARREQEKEARAARPQVTSSAPGRARYSRPDTRHQTTQSTGPRNLRLVGGRPIERIGVGEAIRLHKENKDSRERDLLLRKIARAAGHGHQAAHAYLSKLEADGEQGTNKAMLGEQKVIDVDNFDESKDTGLGEKPEKVLKMSKAGLNVPSHFVIRGNGTGKLEINDELRERFARMKKPVIARSAHPDEGREHSYSGVFESIGDITVLEKSGMNRPEFNTDDYYDMRIEGTLPSPSLEAAYEEIILIAEEGYRSRDYRDKRDIKDFEAKRMNVLVMEQIDYDVFGMFVTSKQDRPDEVLIQYKVILDKGPLKYPQDFSSAEEYEEYMQGREYSGVITYNKKTRRLEDNDLDAQVAGVLEGFGEEAVKIEQLFGVQQIELGANDGEVFVFQSRDINLGDPTDVARFPHYKTIAERMSVSGYGQYRLPVLVIDSAHGVFRETGEIIDKNILMAEYERFFDEHDEYILILKDLTDVVQRVHLDGDRFEFLNKLATKARVVIRNRYQSTVRHEDWGNVEDGGITIWGNNDMYFDEFKHRSSQQDLAWVGENRGIEATIQRIGLVMTGDTMNVLSNTDGVFVWADDDYAAWRAKPNQAMLGDADSFVRNLERLASDDPAVRRQATEFLYKTSGSEALADAMRKTLRSLPQADSHIIEPGSANRPAYRVAIAVEPAVFAAIKKAYGAKEMPQSEGLAAGTRVFEIDYQKEGYYIDVMTYRKEEGVIYDFLQSKGKREGIQKYIHHLKFYAKDLVKSLEMFAQYVQEGHQGIVRLFTQTPVRGASHKDMVGMILLRLDDGKKAMLELVQDGSVANQAMLGEGGLIGIPAEWGREIRPGRFILEDEIVQAMIFVNQRGDEINARIRQLKSFQEHGSDSWAEDMVGVIVEMWEEANQGPMDEYLDPFTVPKSGDHRQSILTSGLLLLLGYENPQLIDQLYSVGHIIYPRSNYEQNSDLYRRYIWAHEEHHRIWHQWEVESPSEVEHMQRLYEKMLAFADTVTLDDEESTMFSNAEGLTLKEILLRGMAAYGELSADEFFVHLADDIKGRDVNANPGLFALTAHVKVVFALIHKKARESKHPIVNDFRPALTKIGEQRQMAAKEAQKDMEAANPAMLAKIKRGDIDRGLTEQQAVAFVRELNTVGTAVLEADNGEELQFQIWEKFLSTENVVLYRIIVTNKEERIGYLDFRVDKKEGKGIFDIGFYPTVDEKFDALDLEADETDPDPPIALVVENEHQRKGIGSSLMGIAMRIAQFLDVNELIVDQALPLSESFYLALNFKEAGRGRFVLSHIGTNDTKFPPIKINFEKANPAMLADEKGGIDFNAKFLEMETNGQSVVVPVPEQLDTLPVLEINGLVPIIINVAPITNLPLILGDLREEKAEEQLLTKLRKGPSQFFLDKVH